MMSATNDPNELSLSQISAFKRLADLSDAKGLQNISSSEASSFSELRTIGDNVKFTEQEWLDWLRSLRSEVIELTASTSGFTGYLTFQYWWANGGGICYCYTLQYKICGDGGNKANINWSVRGRQNIVVHSPDAMWQTCQWISWSTGGWIASHLNLTANLGVDFIFDKSGSDPVASAGQVLRY